MLLTVSTTHRSATDLGFLLHKHPDRVQEFTQSFGVATVFYPQASLLRSGEGWLARHPDRELITRRYLGRRARLTRVALARLAELDDEVEDATEPAQDEQGLDEEALQPPQRRVPLNARR